ncbi:hypothetical protein N7509_003684 [Penicillium cosmopolitanum]|uniref:Major facilitator superfamily (MFS) profile domain-containing protein n=1 Tax=Penicillium cosmopolitanum TaxID=1131564 RepID=A0A9X0BBP6_9EURO|nr:uncharacterized protein N7509_003684 [Penicillium cosmopolitanum]KAJ5403813.1 hypothetical protein N7509_003684 [Penicillium cosmopolitanum]
MSGVVISEYWLDEMGNPSTVMTGTITALYDVGGVFGAIIAAFTVESLGRKRGLMVGAALIVIGSVLMGASVERVLMIVGRIITGLGIGFLTSVAPVYQSEICLPSQRGWHLCCQLTMMLFGLMLAYWINYAFYFHPGAIQWRFPLLFQAVFALYVLFMTPFLPDTPRWLMLHESTPDRGTAVLAKLRNKPEHDPVVQKEKSDILSAINIESEEEGTWKSLFMDGGCAANKRFFLALGIQFMQQTSGINIVSYYAPTLFQDSLGMDQERALFVGCFLQLWYIIASFLTWYMIDSVGRRRLFIIMALGMCIVLVCEAITVAIDSKSSGIAAVFFVFAFEACFTWGWMATVWVYPAEILPLKIRSKGAALAAAADFLGNFLVVEITPPALENIGYKTYIIFAVFNIVAAFIVYCFYPETSYLNLESVDLIFLPDEDRDQEIEAKRNFYQKALQWNVVPRARVAVEEAKARKKAGLAEALGDIEPAQADAKLPGPTHVEYKE